MNPKQVKVVWEDIIFDKRNKEYGAYSLRQEYSGNMVKGTVTMVSIAVVVIIASFFRTPIGKGVEILTKKIDDGTIIIDVPNIIQEVIARPTTPRLANPNSAPIVTAEERPEEPTTEPEPNNIGSASGTPEGTGGPVIETGSGTGIGTGTDGIVEPVVNRVYVIVEEMPSFEGGIDAMTRFLKKKLKYPAAARRLETQGVVYVQFVVSPNGSITDVEVIKGISRECDEEAARVISMMPKWKAGIQNKIPVSVRMVLPIRFAMPKE
jgi:periplasmic protein TonB